MSFTKVCVHIPTTHGSTYCEVFSPAVSDICEPKEARVPSKTVLMVHGLGGSVEHFNQSEIPIMLADQGHTVVCFDWYSHGKSTRLSSKVVAHNTDLFHEQMHDIIHCSRLPIMQSKEFVAHGFSMGCFILLQYCVQYQPLICKSGSSPNAKHAGPRISRVILQSPWDGHFPFALRGLLYVPLLLRVCKPSDMSEIKSIRTLKEILLWMDRGVDYEQSLEQFARLVLHGRSSQSVGSSSPSSTEASDRNKNTGSVDAEENPLSSPSSATDPTSAPTSHESVAVALPTGSDAKTLGVACPVLVIVGTREPPFAVTARRIARHITRAHQTAQQQRGVAEDASAVNSTGNGLPIEESSSPPVAPVKLVYCKYAGHMSFAKHKRGSYVKEFFHEHITQFISS